MHGFPPGYRSRGQLHQDSNDDHKKGNHKSHTDETHTLSKEDYKYLINLLKSSNAETFQSIQNDKLARDSSHIISNISKLPFPHSNTTTMHAFDRLNMDIWGPINTISIDGFNYFLTIVDDHTRFDWTFSYLSVIIHSIITGVSCQTHFMSIYEYDTQTNLYYQHGENNI